MNQCVHSTFCTCLVGWVQWQMSLCDDLRHHNNGRRTRTIVGYMIVVLRQRRAQYSISSSVSPMTEANACAYKWINGNEVAKLSATPKERSRHKRIWCVPSTSALHCKKQLLSWQCERQTDDSLHTRHRVWAVYTINEIQRGRQASTRTTPNHFWTFASVAFQRPVPPQMWFWLQTWVEF